jgi:hypothetical protein
MSYQVPHDPDDPDTDDLCFCECHKAVKPDFARHLHENARRAFRDVMDEAFDVSGKIRQTALKVCNDFKLPEDVKDKVLADIFG